MVSLRTAILSVLLLSQLSTASGQIRPAHIRFRHYSLAQGLSQSSVTAILQDKQGYMWFGTQDGLNRFDGYSFTQFRHTPNDTASILDNYVWSVLEDRDGCLWVGTLNGGLNRYDPEQDRFTRFVHDPADSTSLSANNVTALCLNQKGELLVGTWGGGLQMYDRRTAGFRRIPVMSGRVQCLLEDRSGLLWVGTWDGVESLDSNGHSIARYQNDRKDGRSLSSNVVAALYETSAGVLWVGTYDAGLDRFNRQERLFTRFLHRRDDRRSLASNAIRSLGEDMTGRLWIGTADAGIELCEPDSGAFSHLQVDPFDPDALSSNRIFSLYRDRTGGMWVGSADAGVHRFDPWAQKFSHIRTRPNDPRSLSGNTVRSMVHTKNGELWVGTWGGGLNRLPRGARSFIHYKHDAGNPSSLASNAILSLYEGSDGTIWIGTLDAGMDRFDRANNRFVHYRHNPQQPNSLANDAVMAFTEDHRGHVWIGTSGGGVDRFDPRTGRFMNFRPRAGSPESISGVNVWALHEDRHGILWMGTWGMGLNRFDPDSGLFRRYLHDPADSTSLSNNTVWSVYEDTSGILWLGTWGGGLVRYDPRTDKFRAFTEADGLPNNVVYGILPDDRGNLWLSTNKGVSKFNPWTGVVRNYDALDGLQSDEFNQGAYCRGANGQLFFGGVNGFSAFFPDSIHDNPFPPPVVLTRFQVFNRPVPLGPYLGEGKQLDLSHQENFFSFEFAALSFTVPEKNRYAYMMEGLDRDWVYCGTRRYVSYTQLEGGDYVFRVKASNNDGLWNTAGVSLQIHVEPPFYRTAWFLVSLIILLAGLAYAIYRSQVNKLLEVERLRTRIASDLHDDIGSGLTRIAVLSDIASQQVGTLLTASPANASPARESGGDAGRSIRKVGNIARELVDAMSDVVWSIDPRHESAASLVQRVRAYAFELCEAKNIALSFEAPDVPEASHLSPETLRGLLLVTKEAVTNIARHSKCSIARIRIVFGKKEITLEVNDNGVGFDAAADSGGNGLRNMRERAEKAGGAFSVTSAPWRGTALTITIPSR